MNVSEIGIRIKVDGSPAEQGSRQVTRSLEDIRQKAEATERTLGHFGKSSGDVLDRVKQDMLGVGNSAEQLRQQFAASQRLTDELTGRTGRLGGVMQQLGYQVGDVAAQVSMGGNAFAAVGVQLGQLLGMFGPLGAVMGAAATVGGALAMSLDDSGSAAKSADSALDALSRTIGYQVGDVEELAAKYDSLTAAQRGFEQLNLMAAFETQRRIVREQADALSEAMEDAIPTGGWFDFRDFDADLAPARSVLEKIKSGSIDAAEGLQEMELALRRSGVSIGFTSEQVLTAAGALGEARQEMDRITAMQAKLNGIATGEQEALLGEAFGHASPVRGRSRADITRDETSRLYDLVQAMQDEADLLGKTERQRDIEIAMRRAHEAALTDFGNGLRDTALLHVTERDAILASVNGLADYRDAQEQAREALKKNDQIHRDFEAGLRQTDMLTRQVGMTFTSAFEEAIMQGNNLRDVVSGLTGDLAKLTIRRSITEPLFNFASTAITGALGGQSYANTQLSVTPNHQSVKGFASGGDHLGGFRIVGERGPELEATGPSRIFNADQTARILSGASNKGGGRGMVVNMPISIQGGGTGNKAADEQFARRIGTEVERVVEQKFYSLVVEEQRPGGMLY